MKRTMLVACVMCLLMFVITGCSILSPNAVQHTQVAKVSCTFDGLASGLGDVLRQTSKIQEIAKPFDLRLTNREPAGRSTFEAEVQRKIDTGEFRGLSSLTITYSDGSGHEFKVK